MKKQVNGLFGTKKDLEFVRVIVKEDGGDVKGTSASPAKHSRQSREESYRGTPLASVVSGMKAIEERRRHE
jgi:hypothetical protein